MIKHENTCSVKYNVYFRIHGDMRTGVTGFQLSSRTYKSLQEAENHCISRKFTVLTGARRSEVLKISKFLLLLPIGDSEIKLKIVFNDCPGSIIDLRVVNCLACTIRHAEKKLHH